MISLAIRDELDLPDSAVTNSFALLAMKGAGKSNAAVVFAEQLFRLGIPWVCIDPKGDWWGIRSGANGKRGGLAVPIFGGLHADVPIDPGAGALFADLVVEHHLTCLIDVSELTKGESIRFLTAFFDRLYRLKNRSTYPMHLFLEECDDYVPQKVYSDIAPLVRTVELVVKRGRQRGLGITLASQRSASINKDVLTQTDTLIVLRTTSPQDRKAVLEWINYNAGAREIVDELPTLRDGEAWVSSPAQLRILAKVKFRRRSTFDSGATPELGEKVKAATLADIDVEAITASVGDLVEKAKADDPRVLRARIRELEKHPVIPDVVTIEKEVEVPIVPPEMIRALGAALAEYDEAIDRFSRTRDQIAKIMANSGTEFEKLTSSSALRVSGGICAPLSTGSLRSSRHEAIEREHLRRTTRPKPVKAALDALPAERLGKRERAILTALAQHGEISMRTLALLTGYSVKASTVGAGLSTLRKQGFVEGMVITDAGRAALGSFEPLPEGRALYEYWLGQVGKRERLIMDALLEVFPQSMANDELAAVCGYSAEASTIGAGLSKLRGLGIVEGGRLSAEFYESVRG